MKYLLILYSIFLFASAADPSIGEEIIRCIQAGLMDIDECAPCADDIISAIPKCVDLADPMCWVEIAKSIVGCLKCVDDTACAYDKCACDICAAKGCTPYIVKFPYMKCQPGCS